MGQINTVFIFSHLRASLTPQVDSKIQDVSLCDIVVDVHVICSL